MPVSIDAPVGQTKSTNDAGCVVFDGLNTGTYFGQFSKPGYVDMGGNNVVRPANGFNVTTGSTSVSTFAYDKAATAASSSARRVGGTEYRHGEPRAPAEERADAARRRAPRAVPGSQATWGYTNLFPFDSGYTAFAVACAADAPTGGGTILTSPPWTAQAVTNKAGDPGHNQTPVKVFLPSINAARDAANGATTGLQRYAHPRARRATRRLRPSRRTGATTTPAGRPSGRLAARPTPAAASRPAATSSASTDRPLGAATVGAQVEQTVDTTAGADVTPPTINMDNASATTARALPGTCAMTRIRRRLGSRAASRSSS